MFCFLKNFLFEILLILFQGIFCIFPILTKIQEHTKKIADIIFQLSKQCWLKKRRGKEEKMKVWWLWFGIHRTDNYYAHKLVYVVCASPAYLQIITERPSDVVTKRKNRNLEHAEECCDCSQSITKPDFIEIFSRRLFLWFLNGICFSRRAL